MCDYYNLNRNNNKFIEFYIAKTIRTGEYISA